MQTTHSSIHTSSRQSHVHEVIPQPTNKPSPSSSIRSCSCRPLNERPPAEAHSNLTQARGTLWRLGWKLGCVSFRRG